MLLHFLRHYHRLGVWPSHTSVAIRARRSASLAATNATLRVLQQAGVPDSNVRMIHAPPSDTLKIQLMNEHLESLPSTAWSIYADVDELFDYPCELQGAVVRKKLCFSGTMLDQLSASGNITEMQETPDLAAQYPLQCRIRSTVVPHVQANKVILHRVYGNAGFKGGAVSPHLLVRFRSTHSIIGNNSASSRCALNGSSPADAACQRVRGRDCLVPGRGVMPKSDKRMTALARGAWSYSIYDSPSKMNQERAAPVPRSHQPCG